MARIISNYRRPCQLAYFDFCRLGEDFHPPHPSLPHDELRVESDHGV